MLGGGDLSLESYLTSYEAPVHFWEETGEAIHAIPGTNIIALSGASEPRFYVAHSSTIRCVAASSVSGVAASAAGDGGAWELHIWQPTNLQSLITLLPPEGAASPVVALSFSRDGERLVGMVAGAQPRALLWDWGVDPAAQLLCSLVDAHGAPTLMLCLPAAPSAAIPQLITGNSRVLRFWVTAKKSSVLHPLDADPAVARGATCVLEVPTPPIAGAPDGARGGGGALVVSAHASGELRAWRLWQRGKEEASVRLVCSRAGHQGAALALASCGDNAELVASGGADAYVRLWTAYLDPISRVNLAHCWAARPLLTHAAVLGLPMLSDGAAPPTVRGLCAAGAGTLLLSAGDLLSLHVGSGECRLLRSGGHGESPTDDDSERTVPEATDGSGDEADGPWVQPVAAPHGDTLPLLLAAAPVRRASPHDEAGVVGVATELATAGNDRTLRLWRCGAGVGPHERGSMLLHATRLREAPCALAWSTRGKHVAVADRTGGLQLYRSDGLVAEPHQAALPYTSFATCLSFDAMDTRVAVGGSDGSVSLWRVPELELVHTFPAHSPACVLSIDWSTAGHASAGAALLTSAAPRGAPMEARVWRAADGYLLSHVTDTQLRAGGAAEGLMPVSHTPKRSLSDGALLSWPWLSYTCAAGWRVRSAAASTAGSHVSATCRLGGGRPGSDQLAAIAPDGSMHLAPFGCAGVLDASTRLSTPTDRLLGTSELVPAGRRRSGLAFSVGPGGSHVFTAAPGSSPGRGGAVLVWRLHKRPPPVPPLSHAPFGRSSGWVDDLTHSGDSTALAVRDMEGAEGDDAMRLVPLRGPSRLPTLPPSALSMPVRAVGGAGGDVVCALGGIAVVSPWHGSGRRMYTAHDETISALAVHPSGGVVATGQAGAVRLWSLASMQTLAVLGGRAGRGGAHSGIFAPTVLAFSPDGRSMLSLVPLPDPNEAAAAAFASASGHRSARTANAVVESIEYEAVGDQNPEPPMADKDAGGVTAESTEAAIASAVEAEQEAMKAAARFALRPPDDPVATKGPGGPAPRPANNDASTVLPSSGVLAVWDWSGGPSARPLAGGVVHVSRPVAQARAHQMPALCACFLQEEEVALSGGDGGVRLASGGVGHVRFWQLEHGRLIVTSEPPPSQVCDPSSGGGGGGVHLSCCATAPAVFFGTDDGSLLQFAPASGTLIQRFAAHHGPLTSLVALSPLDTPPVPGVAVASGGVDGHLRLWSAAALPLGEWRLATPVNALRDERGRPLRLGSCGDAAGHAAVRGVSWAGPRGAVAQAGRATLTIDATSSATELCLLPLPAASARESVVLDVWRAWPLPSCELTRRAVAQRPEGFDAPTATPAEPTAMGMGVAGAMAKPTATTRLTRQAGAWSDGWGRDDDEVMREATIPPPAETAAAVAAAPASGMMPPTTIRVGGWHTDSATGAAVESCIASSGARVCHEALTRWS